MAYRNTFFRWLFLYSLTFGLTYVLKLFTYLCPETGQSILFQYYRWEHYRNSGACSGDFKGARISAVCRGCAAVRGCGGFWN